MTTLFAGFPNLVCHSLIADIHGNFKLQNMQGILFQVFQNKCIGHCLYQLIRPDDLSGVLRFTEKMSKLNKLHHP